VERWNDRLEAICSVLERLRLENEEFPVIVEGRKDTQSLRAVGLTGEIIEINNGKSIVAMCEGLAEYGRVILLFDWDRKGGQLTRAFSEALKTEGVDYDTRIRSELAVLVKKDIKDVEGLGSMVERLKTSTAQPAGGQG